MNDVQSSASGAEVANEVVFGISVHMILAQVTGRRYVLALSEQGFFLVIFFALVRQAPEAFDLGLSSISSPLRKYSD